MIRLAILFLFAVAAIAGDAPMKEQPLAVILSKHDGSVYSSSFTRSDIESSPLWRRDKSENPPLSPAKAISVAQSMLQTIIPTAEIEKEWRLSSLMLVPTADVKAKGAEWFYVVKWRGPRVEFERKKYKDGQSLLHDKYSEFALYVLMNGKCIEPKKLTPNKRIHATN